MLRLRDKALKWGFCLLAASILLYGISALVMRNPGKAWALLEGVGNPRVGSFPALEYALSFVGYLIVPVVIAVCFVGLVDRSIRKDEQTVEEAEAAAKKDMGLKEEGSPAATTAPVIDEKDAPNSKPSAEGCTR